MLDLFGDFETAEATYDVSDTSAVTIAGGIVTFSPPFDGVAGGSYFVEAPAGLVVSASGAVPSRQIGLGGDDVQWFFDVVAPDTTPPVHFKHLATERCGRFVSGRIWSLV